MKSLMTPRKSILALEPSSVSPAERVQLLARVAGFYHRAFMDCPEGVRYLTKVCGIRDVSLFKTFQVGLANGTLTEVLPKDREPQAALKALGIVTEAGREFLEGCVVFPLWSAQGVVVNLCGRRIADEMGTELFLPGDIEGLWNYQAAKRSSSVVLASSLIDALTAVDRGLLETMPCLDAGGLSADLQRLLEHRGVRHVVTALAGNRADRLAAVTKALAAKGIAVAVADLPDGETLNSYLTGKHGEEARVALQERVAEAFASLVDGGRSPRIAILGERYERTAHGFKLALYDRRYEVKGIARETTQLKATIKASGSAAKGFELTTLDLYSARSREAYTRACVALFGEGETIVRADLNRVLERVEAWQADGAKASDIPEASPEDTARALAFLGNPDLFDEILADLRVLGIAGEETNKLLCYLATISRKLDDPLSLLIQSRSAAGKSTLQHAILSLTPDEDQVHYTRLTSQALFYQEEMRLVHKVLALEEAEGLGEAAYSLRALQSAKKLTIATTTKDPLTGKMKTAHYVVQGPVAVLLTTTSASLDEETAGRFLTLTIDESKEMTETILAAQRHRDTLEGYLAELDKSAVIAKHHTAQRLLDPLVVINPFARELTFPVHSLRARRDHKKYLMLIKSIAFLYQKQRSRKRAERGGQAFDYIEVTKDDIRRANGLANRVLAHSLDELSAPARSLLKHIHSMVTGHCESHGVEPSQYAFTRKSIREATGWSDWQVRTHAKELEELEYLKARSGTWGKEYVYELAWQGDREDSVPLGLALADPDTLTGSP